MTLCVSCGKRVHDAQKVDQQPQIYPDYVDVTIPAGIAPLDFAMVDEQVERIDVTIKGDKEGEMHAAGDYTDFDIDKWHQLTEQNRGADLILTVCALRDGKWTQYEDFRIHVSNYSLDDYGLTYRRIPPGYEVGGNIGIYQRDLHTFDESPIFTETLVPGRCMNCHTANRTDPSQLTMQIRGDNGGTLIQRDGHQEWLNTKTETTKAAGSYAYWHPDGDYCAYAVNSVHQSFYVGKDRRIEAYHKFSDIVLLDTRTNKLLLSPLLRTDDLEIFPAFSADGKTLYYSSSKPCNVPQECEQVKCSLCAISFDAVTGKFGETVDTLLNARELNKSVTIARPSYDGRWLMYTVADYSNFPIFHSEADLWLMDLTTKETRALTKVNSLQTESWHNWSSNSHWFVFSSKREDGMYAQLFLASIDEQGNVTKPFLLPQRNPRKFYRELMDSYNVPDFTKVKVNFDAHEAQRLVNNEFRRQVEPHLQPLSLNI